MYTVLFIFNSCVCTKEWYKFRKVNWSYSLKEQHNHRLHGGQVWNCFSQCISWCESILSFWGSLKKRIIWFKACVNFLNPYHMLASFIFGIFFRKCFHFCILAVSGGIHLRNIIWEDSHHLLRGDKQIDIYIRATLPICLMKFPPVPVESYAKRLAWEI